MALDVGGKRAGVAGELEGELHQIAYGDDVLAAPGEGGLDEALVRCAIEREPGSIRPSGSWSAVEASLTETFPRRPGRGRRCGRPRPPVVHPNTQTDTDTLATRTGQNAVETFHLLRSASAAKSYAYSLQSRPGQTATQGTDNVIIVPHELDNLTFITTRSPGTPRGVEIPVQLTLPGTEITASLAPARRPGTRLPGRDGNGLRLPQRHTLREVELLLEPDRLHRSLPCGGRRSGTPTAPTSRHG
ncbi:hypothetical protein ACPCAC_13445 [Streptomyces lavendulocolor]|uniref:hypothetical protein n=1 Tax=Streptomyces lavendulocolor TaxID=67316 RepID=UPI003C2F09D1